MADKKPTPFKFPFVYLLGAVLVLLILYDLAGLSGGAPGDPL